MPKIRCLLTDDHTLFRQGIRRLLETESDFEVVGEASDAGESVEKARELRPDIVLMDIGMPGLSSFEAARQVVRYLADLGHRRIAFVNWHQEDLNPWRLQGYRQGLRDARLPRRRAWELAVELTSGAQFEATCWRICWRVWTFPLGPGQYPATGSRL